MQMIPYERLIIKSSLSADEAQQRLQDHLEPARNFRWGWSKTKDYEGRLQDGIFSVRRILRSRNSFQPMIDGEILSEIDGCAVRIRMRPHILVSVFMAIWLGFIALLFLGILRTLAADFIQTGALSASPFDLLFPGALFILGYGLLLGGFKYESRKSKAFFRELFQARQMDELGIQDLFGGR